MEAFIVQELIDQGTDRVIRNEGEERMRRRMEGGISSSGR